MKAQVLANFVIECTMSYDNPEDKLNDKLMQIEIFKADLSSIWVLHVDGASNV